MSFFKSLGNIFGNALTFGAYGQQKAMQEQARMQRDAVNRANEETRRANLRAEAENKVAEANAQMKQNQVSDMNMLAFQFGNMETDTNVLPRSTGQVPQGTFANMLTGSK